MITLTMSDDALWHLQEIVKCRFYEFVDDYQDHLMDEDGEMPLRGKAARDKLARLNQKWRLTLDAIGLDIAELVCNPRGKRYSLAVSGEGDV